MLASRRVVAALTALVLAPVLALSVTPPTTAAPAAAAPGPIFTPMSGLSLGRDATVRPARYVASRANLPALRAALGAGGKVALALPDPSGASSTFTLVEDSVMAPALQAAHPEIRTYRGAAADGSSIRLDVTPFGVHAMVRMPDGKAWYVDPATKTVGESRVLSYAGVAVPAPSREFVERDVDQAATGRSTDAVAAFATPGGEVVQRTFRLALLTDPTYAEYVAPGADEATSDSLVLAAKTTLINRVNEVYNDDLGIRFQLIDGTDTALNLRTEAEATGANGPCGSSPCFAAPSAPGAGDGDLDGCGLSTLNRMEFATGQLVGAENFDIGHLGLGVNGGGVAGLGVVGGLGNPTEFQDQQPDPDNYFNADKSAGCTGLPDPIGDFYAIDYVAHEMGHQMGSDHTFNGVQLNCSEGNRETTPFDLQVEPGSGSSVMAYAGICGSDDLQPHSDPYFSFASNDVIGATTAAPPAFAVERQAVDLTGFGAANDTFSLEGDEGVSDPITTANYTADDLEQAVLDATGYEATVTPYDTDPTLRRNGFFVTWTAQVGDVSPLELVATTGVSGTVATIRDGGATTNNGAEAPTSNRAPVVTAPADKTIPAQTPFTLTGSATDGDGDVLTYLWEQTDAGGEVGTGLVSNTKVDGPLFRQFGTAAQVSDANSLLYNSPGENLAGTTPSRTFPDLAQVVGGVTNAKTGACPAAPTTGTIPQATVDCFSEFLPTPAWVGDPSRGSRVMHFRLTARDEFSADAALDHVGGSRADEVALTVNPEAGPFLVTSRAVASSAAGAETVTWDVARTQGMAANVKISLSTDGGLTFPTVLSASTPNDGSEVVVLPNVTTSTARIKVEAVDNYFFAVNDADFSIKPAPTTHVGDGKGRYTSPAGSSRLVKRASGPTRLKFTVDRTGAALSGSAKVRFQRGKIRFKGDDVTAATVAGRVLSLTVEGTNRGKDGYRLELKAKDAKKEKVRVRIFKGKRLVYDSMPGARASKGPRTTFSGDINLG